MVLPQGRLNLLQLHVGLADCTARLGSRPRSLPPRYAGHGRGSVSSWFGSKGVTMTVSAPKVTRHLEGYTMPVAWLVQWSSACTSTASLVR